MSLLATSSNGRFGSLKLAGLLAGFTLAIAACGDSSGTGGEAGGGGSGGSGSEGGAGGGASASQTYVLVHGAFAGGWSWERLVTQLEANGDEVITLDLPAHGDDPTAPEQATLQAYSDVVVEALDGASKPVVLVGHSMGGLVVSQAAEARPEKVAKLVYLAAFLVEDGTSLLAAAGGDPESTLQDFVATDATSATLAPEGILGSFCSDCSADDAALIEEHLRPEPLAGFTTPIKVSAEKWGSVPRFYIETLQDKAIGPSKQAEFYTALPCEKVVSIDAGHCPFLTQPEALFEALTDL
jgi:pimeloyl-ACP methyl ester carboxylesterase